MSFLPHQTNQEVNFSFSTNHIEGNCPMLIL